jgi:Oxysterol-binding protein
VSETATALELVARLHFYFHSFINGIKYPGTILITFLHLLQAAAEPKGSLERLLFVAAYTVAAYSLHPLNRTDKLLDPILHETYELVDEKRGVRYMCEAVRVFAASPGPVLSYVDRMSFHPNNNLHKFYPIEYPYFLLCYLCQYPVLIGLRGLYFRKETNKHCRCI